MESNKVAEENDLHLKATELRLGLPGRDDSEEEALFGARNNKRPFPDARKECGSKGSSDHETYAPAK